MRLGFSLYVEPDGVHRPEEDYVECDSFKFELCPATGLFALKLYRQVNGTDVLTRGIARVDDFWVKEPG